MNDVFTFLRNNMSDLVTINAQLQPTYTVYLHFSAIFGPHILSTFTSKEPYEKLQELVRTALIIAFSPSTLLNERYFEKERDYGKQGIIHICHSIGFNVKTNKGYEDNYQCTFFTPYCAELQIQASKRPIEYIHFETNKDWFKLNDYEKKYQWATELKKQVEVILNKAKPYYIF